MASYSVAEAKDRLPSLIVAAERGEEVRITRYGKPVVALVASGAAAITSPIITREMLDELRTSLKDIPVTALDMAALVREMRDED